MSSKTVQWILWAVAMAVFSWLALTGRWTDLAMVMTVAGLLWYGLVPQTSSRRH